MSHTGNQQLVLGAIQRGNRKLEDIMRVTCLDYDAVSTAARRLADQKLVRRANGRGEYLPVIPTCALAEAWK